MAFFIFRNYYFRIILINLTKCNILKTFELKNNGKYTYHNLEKLCPWFLLGLDHSWHWSWESLSSKSRLLALYFFEFLALASKVVSSTPLLYIMLQIQMLSLNLTEDQKKGLHHNLVLHSAGIWDLFELTALFYLIIQTLTLNGESAEISFRVTLKSWWRYASPLQFKYGVRIKISVCAVSWSRFS